MRHRALLAAGASFSPLSLSPALWLETWDAATVTESGGAVSQLNDKSGNNRHVVQATAGAKPTTGAATRNGLNVFSFDGGDHLRSSSAVTIAQPFTIVFAAINDNPTGPTGGRIVCHRSSINLQTIHSDGAVGYRTAGVYAGGADFAKGPANAYSTAVWGISSFVVNGASTKAYVNGTAGSTFNAGATALDLVMIGARHDGTNPQVPLVGKFAAALVFPSALSDTDRQAVEAYLNGLLAIY